MKRLLIATLALTPVAAITAVFAIAPCPACVLAKFGL